MIEFLYTSLAGMTVVAVFMNIDFTVFAKNKEVNISLSLLEIHIDNSRIDWIAECQSKVIYCNSKCQYIEEKTHNREYGMIDIEDRTDHK